MDKKIISDEEVQNGISSGKFKEDGAIIRNIENGQIVKHQHNDNPNSLIPSSLIQVNHSYIYYKTDINTCLNKIQELQITTSLKTLDIVYESIKDQLQATLNYNKTPELLNNNIIENLSAFQREVKDVLNIPKYNKELENYLRQYSSIIPTITQYVNILYIYILNTFKLYEKSSFIKDNIAINKISVLKEKIKNIYEYLLIPNNFSNSIYIDYFLNKDSSLEDAFKYNKFDSRYSDIELLELFKNKHNSNSSNRHYNNEYSINMNVTDVNKRKDIIYELYIILEDIENLENIHEELKDDSFDNSDYEHIIKAIMQR